MAALSLLNLLSPLRLAFGDGLGVPLAVFIAVDAISLVDIAVSFRPATSTRSATCRSSFTRGTTSATASSGTR